MSYLTRRKSKTGAKKCVEDTYTVSNLPSLRRKRTIAFNRISKALEIGTLANTDDTQIELFLSYCQEATKIADSFQEAHLIILDLLNDDAEDSDIDIQEQFDDAYFKVIALQRKFKSSSSEQTDTSKRNSISGVHGGNMRLPKISLPTFSGAIKEWPEFIATYNALIHESSALSDIEKFHYLVSVLRNDALSLIRTFPVASEHYLSAYNALKSRYEDKRELAFTCWRDILDVTFKTTNAQDFRHALDTIDENLSILKKLKLPTEHWDFVLCYNILSKLDAKLRREFEEKHTDVELPQYKQIRAFLHSKSEALMRDTHFTAVNNKTTHAFKESSGSQKPKRYNVTHSLIAPTVNMNKSSSEKQEAKPPSVSTTSKLIRKCSFCGDDHHISACKAFLTKSVDERMAVAGEKRWCYNCLNASHGIRQCTSIFTCQKCKRKHHTLLHREQAANNTDASSDQPKSVTLMAKQPSIDLAQRSPSVNTTVLLATAIVQIRDADGEFHTFRAIFDTGSQNNFLTARAAQQLKLQPKVPCTNVKGLGGTPTSLSGMVTCDVGTDRNVKFTLDMLVISNICDEQPISKLNTSGWDEVKTLPLADPGFDIPGPIDVLLDADVFAESLLGQRLKRSASQPWAFNSVFGWLLLGRTRLASSSCLVGTASPNVDDSLNSIVQRFWEIDNVPQSSRLTPDEQLCENNFVTNHHRDEAGRYVVCLPFKDNAEPEFEGSRALALRRFHAIERRLSRDPTLKQQYVDFMADYIKSGHMTLVPANQMGQGKYYIPHHCVVRPDSATTKLRVVFDASAKDVNGKSLNESLLTGPKLQSNIVEILLHYREHEVVFMADVRQMYRQINVSPHHRDYQRILWRAHPDEPLQEYILNTVTYGVSSAPFLACRTIQQLAADEGHLHPKAQTVLTSDIYVDDIVTGSSTLQDAHEIKSQVIALFGLGSFELRKWVSNRPELLSDLPSEACLSEAITFTDVKDTTVKVLGLKWEPTSDVFVFNVHPLSKPCSKRTILSEVARIFDPLGFLAPLTILAKGLVQQMWSLGFSWDQTPPPEIVTQWTNLSQQLPQIRELQVPRKFTSEKAQSYQLHGFCDSSEQAYGAVVYLRVTETDGSVRVFLLCAKARVAPLKKQSLPRLELCGAVLLADLIKFVKSTLRIPVHETYLWCDSTVTLAWLRAPSSRWVTFVANRVSHVQDIVPTECWRHVPSASNPADVCSRGQLPQDLLNNSLWWAGPEWLSRSQAEWPADISKCHRQDNDVVLSEQRRNVALVTEQTDQASIIDRLFTKYSSLDKICRILAYVRRFCNHAHKIDSRPDDTVVTDIERHRALLIIVKHFQNRCFSDVITRLKLKKQLPRSFRKLSPFLDDQGILRVGGRLARSGLEFEHKHPALLPRKCVLTATVIEAVHRNNLHPGLNTTHYLILQQFWILAAKCAIRRQLSKCIRCYRLHPEPLQPFMSDLPAFRVNQAKSFSEVGVDFGGPFRIKLGKHRGAKIDKAYLCLFVCLSTKAVHLEVVSTLSTDGFIAALRRFVARRGRCNIIHSDCGTNFVGASSQLAACMEQASHAERIVFKRNPPSAPHFGGVWEIQIKAAKSHLYRIVGDQTLTFEELTTLFTQIESILNSRPICPLSSDPNDISVLSPGHFLTLEPLTAVPDPDYTDVKISRLDRWQLIQSFQQQFWKRWKHEYLHALTQRAKWTKDSKPLAVNSIVLIKDDNQPPLHWPLGRVVSLHPGPDGVVRVATLRTAKDHLVKRPLVKLCPLPTE